MATQETMQDMKSRGALWGFGVFGIIVMVVMIILGAWWGSEPGQFNIMDEAEKRAEEMHETDAIPIGYVYTNTLAHIAEVLLHKPGGYITNDV